MEFVIGIVCGILLSLFFSLGPAFFSLIQNSIHHGFRKAVFFATGVSLSDIIIVMLMLTVLQNFDLSDLLHNVYVASIGGAAIGFFGVHTFRSKVKKLHRKDSKMKFRVEGAAHRWQLLLYGFLLNFLNPLIWIYWVTIVTFLSAEMDLPTTSRYIFFLGMLIAVFGTDVLKCRLASLMQAWFTARRFNIFNKITGLILIAFAIYLIVSMVLYQTNPQIREKEKQQSKSTRIIQTLHNQMHRDTSKQCDTLKTVIHSDSVDLPDTLSL